MVGGEENLLSYTKRWSDDYFEIEEKDSDKIPFLTKCLFRNSIFDISYDMI